MAIRYVVFDVRPFLGLRVSGQGEPTLGFSSHCFAPLLMSFLFVDWRIQVQAQRLVVDWNTCVSFIHAYDNDIDLN